MREIIESGFRFRLPEAECFRLSENVTYQSLSGRNLKEMDIGWWRSTERKLFFIELKGAEIWENFRKSPDQAHEYLVKSLNKKTTDVLLMLTAMWSGTKIGETLKSGVPEAVHDYIGDGNLKFIFLIDTPVSHKALYAPIKDAINKALAGRMQLFGVNRVTLLDFDLAQKLGLPVERIN